MAAQAYGDWGTIVNESLVRACTVRYFSERFGPAAERDLIKYQASQSFLWVGELSQLLDQYEHERGSYPRLESFMPRVVQYFDRLAPRVGDIVKRAAKS